MQKLKTKHAYIPPQIGMLAVSPLNVLFTNSYRADIEGWEEGGDLLDTKDPDFEDEV